MSTMPEEKQEKKPNTEASLYVRACQGAMVFLVTVLALVGLLSLILPKPTVSEYEKRELAKFPAFSAKALWSGEWLRDFEAYYADTFPGRDGFIAVTAVLDDWKGIRGKDDIKIYNTNQGGASQPPAPVTPPETSAPSSPSSLPESQSPSGSSGGESQTEDPSVSSQPESSSASSTPDAPPEVPDGYLTEGYCIVGDRGMTLFGGYRPVADQYADILTRFAGKVAGQAQVYNIVVPCSGEFYLPEKYQSLSNSQKENIEYLYSKMGPEVTTVDAYSWLARNTEKYIYFRTDHHWTGLGAYYAYVAFCRAAEIENVNLDHLEKRTIQPFLGTVYNATRDPRLEQSPDYVDYWITAPNATAKLWLKGRSDPLEVYPWSEGSAGGNSYGVFIWADNPLFAVHNPDLANGRKALVLKESYGNAFAPWLFANFEDVYVIDYRHYEKSVTQFVQENGVDTVIFINNSFAANTGFHAQRIDYLCNQLG